MSIVCAYINLSVLRGKIPVEGVLVKSLTRARFLVALNLTKEKVVEVPLIISTVHFLNAHKSC